MTAQASHRRRFAVGLVSALIVGAALSQWVLNRARGQENELRVTRIAVVGVSALAEISERAGGAGDPLRRAFAEFVRDNPEVSSARVVVLDGISLEASNAPEDRGDKAAPRRLAHEEKPLYDQAQRLRAAVETNHQEGAARKTEVETAPASGGRVAVAAPLEKDGAVVGMATLETVPLPSAPRPDWLFPILVVIVAGAVFWLVTLAVGERRALLAVTASVVLVAAMAVLGRHAFTTVSGDRRASESAVASAVAAEAGRAARAVQEIGPGAPGEPLHASRWDADLFRRPVGTIGDDGRVDEAKLQQGISAGASSTTRVVGAMTVLALALLLFVGFGAAGRLGVTIRKHRQAYTYTFPALFGMLVLVFLPFLYGVTISFTDFSLYTSQAPLAEIWVGVKNFVEILGDFHVAKSTATGLIWNYQNFYWTLGVTIVWTATNVAYGVGMGLFLALILNTKGLLFRPIYRVLFILPWAMPNYITALIWKGMFHQQFGVINQIIQMVGGTPVSWFESPGTSLFACIATNAWLSVPFMMVISLGALQSIPADLYEAARVDGATRWQQFRSITLPSLKPALVPAVILSVIWTFNMFNIIYLVSGGDPAHSTEILITQAYKFAFEQYRYGYAAAYSMVIFGILLAYGVWQNKVTKATEGI